MNRLECPHCGLGFEDQDLANAECRLQHHLEREHGIGKENPVLPEGLVHEKQLESALQIHRREYQSKLENLLEQHIVDFHPAPDLAPPAMASCAECDARFTGQTLAEVAGKLQKHHDLFHAKIERAPVGATSIIQELLRIKQALGIVAKHVDELLA